MISPSGRDGRGALFRHPDPLVRAARNPFRWLGKIQDRHIDLLTVKSADHVSRTMAITLKSMAAATSPQSGTMMVGTVKSIVAIVKLRARAGSNTGEASNDSARISAIAGASSRARPHPGVHKIAERFGVDPGTVQADRSPFRERKRRLRRKVRQ